MGVEIHGICTLLEVFDMRRAVDFYRDALGFEVARASSPGEDFDWCLLRHGATELMLNTHYEREERPDSPDMTRVAAHADTSLFLSCPDLDGAYAHLRKLGVDVQPPIVRDYGMRQLSLKDPDGYSIYLQWPAS